MDISVDTTIGVFMVRPTRCESHHTYFASGLGDIHRSLPNSSILSTPTPTSFNIPEVVQGTRRGTSCLAIRAIDTYPLVQNTLLTFCWQTQYHDLEQYISLQREMNIVFEK